MQMFCTSQKITSLFAVVVCKFFTTNLHIHFKTYLFLFFPCCPCATCMCLTCSDCGCLFQFEGGKHPDPDMVGLMQRSFSYLLQQAESVSGNKVIRASYLEIYNEQVNLTHLPILLPLQESIIKGEYYLIYGYPPRNMH